MKPNRKAPKIKLIYLAVCTLLLVGLVPLLLTGWLLSGRTGRELRAVENRYQIQLVQEKARQIELFGQHYSDLVLSLRRSFELARSSAFLASPETEQQLGQILKNDGDILALYLKPSDGESLSVFRPGVFATGEYDSIVTDAASRTGAQELLIGQPVKLASGDYAMTLSSKVRINEQVAASIVAIVSLKEIGKSIVGMEPTQ